MSYDVKLRKDSYNITDIIVAVKNDTPHWPIGLVSFKCGRDKWINLSIFQPCFGDVPVWLQLRWRAADWMVYYSVEDHQVRCIENFDLVQRLAQVKINGCRRACAVNWKKIKQQKLLRSWSYSRYSARNHLLVRGHTTTKIIKLMNNSLSGNDGNYKGEACLETRS